MDLISCSRPSLSDTDATRVGVLGRNLERAFQVALEGTIQVAAKILPPPYPIADFWYQPFISVLTRLGNVETKTWSTSSWPNSYCTVSTCLCLAFYRSPRSHHNQQQPCARRTPMAHYLVHLLSGGCHTSQSRTVSQISTSNTLNSPPPSPRSSQESTARPFASSGSSPRS